MPLTRRRAWSTTLSRGAIALAILAAAGCSGGGGGSVSTAPAGSSGGAGTAGTSGSASASGSAVGSAQEVAPLPLTVEVVTGGLEHGWDLGFLPDGQILLTERPGRLRLLSSGAPGASVATVQVDLADVYAKGEGGLLGLAIHPDFATTRQFTVCLDHAENGAPVDVRLVTYRLAPDNRSATKVKDLVTGLPINPSGRHSGCRPTVAQDGTLMVGTGDTANGRIAQDKASLGGKVLRVDLVTGQAPTDNPFADAANPRTRLISTYGHRNVQGVAVRPGSGAVYTAEHGPSIEDEVNLNSPGGNYGWDPSRGGTVGGYDESVPMTDLTRFLDAKVAVWNTGDHTEALSGAAFVTGAQWGDYDGALAVGSLKGSKLFLLRLAPPPAAEGTLLTVTIPKEMNGTFGRLRAVRSGPDGALYVTTSNGDNDKLLRITPAS